MNKVIPLQITADRSSLEDSLATRVIQDLGPSADFFARDPGETLFSIGQKPGNVLILLDGNVKLSTDSEDGRTLILEIAGANEVLELSSVIADEPYDKTASTLTLCRLASVTISDFDSLLRCSRNTLMVAVSELNNSYKQSCNQIQLLGEGSGAFRLRLTVNRQLAFPAGLSLETC